MKNFTRFFVSIALVFAFLFNGLPSAKACGPFTVDPLFEFTKHGEYPLESYTNGRVGVVPNSYGRISLFVFYRQLNNTPLTENERKQVVEAMKHRIGIHVSDAESAQPDNNQTLDEPDYFTIWMNARAKVLEEKTTVTTEKKVPNDYSVYYNCLSDSFNTAAKTTRSQNCQIRCQRKYEGMVKRSGCGFLELRRRRQNA